MIKQQRPISADATISKRIKKFRLLTACAIIGNRSYTSGSAGDMDADQAMGELCEQYCLSIFLEWLATRYNFPVCSEAIELASGELPGPLSSWSTICDRYPLYCHWPILSLGLDPKRLREKCFAALDDLLEARFELLGAIYQQQLSHPLHINSEGQPYIEKAHDQRYGGEFYTPSQVVDYCFARAFDDGNSDLINRIDDAFALLDPSCGSGNFLSGALRFLRARKDFSAGQIYHFTARSIHGRDVDARAADLCRLSLLIDNASYINSIAAEHRAVAIADLLRALDRNIKVSDSVVEWSSGGGTGSFDLIVGNPPYVSYGARNQPVLQSDWQKFLKKSYPSSAEYKIRLHSIFQEISIRAAKNGGHIVLLLPDAFFTGSYYGKLRNLLLDKTQIVSLSELPADTVPGAVVGRWSVPHYRKGAQDGLVQLYQMETAASVNSYSLPLDLLVSTDCSRFQLVFNDNDAWILQAIKNLVPLSTLLRGHTGIRARAGQKSIIASAALSASYRRGLVSGAQVSPFSVSWQGHWLDITPDKLFAGGFNANIVEQPKILVRQTGDRITAALDAQGFYHLNNVHSFSGKAHDLLFLAALLNSSFYQYLYALKSREKKRALAQIDIEMVEALPLPEITSDASTRLTALAEQMTEYSTHAFDFAPLKNECDAIVFEAYGLPSKIIRHIQYESQVLAGAVRGR